jgi:hypothetical protein
VFGLTYPDVAIPHTESFFHSWRAQVPNAHNQFSMQMCLHDGQLWLGNGEQNSEADQTYRALHSGRMHYTRLDNHQGHYAVRLQTIHLATHQMPYHTADAAVLDSGSSLSWLPQTLFDAIARTIDADAYFRSIFTSVARMEATFCQPLAMTRSKEEMNRRLPPLTLDFEGGLKLVLPAVGSYIVPCDAEMTKWQWGFVRQYTGRNLLLLGW